MLRKKERIEATKRNYKLGKELSIKTVFDKMLSILGLLLLRYNHYFLILKVYINPS